MAAALSLLEEVLALAKSLKALRPDQLAHILEIAPKMGKEDLMKVKVSLENIQGAEVTGMKEELDVRKKAALAYHAWSAEKMRSALQIQEGAAQRTDEAKADALIQNI